MMNDEQVEQVKMIKSDLTFCVQWFSFLANFSIWFHGEMMTCYYEISQFVNWSGKSKSVENKIH